MAGIRIDEKKLNDNQRLWDCILAFDGAEFTVRDLHLNTNVSTTTVRDYMKRYCNGGYIGRIGKIGHQNTFVALKKVRLVPRLNTKGEVVTQGLGCDYMWRAMKMMKRFNKRDLAAQASTEAVKISVHTAETYIKYLCRAGYVKCTKQGGSHILGEYMFIPSKNTGSRAPMIQRVKNVYDPNLKKVVWTSQEASNE